MLTVIIPAFNRARQLLLAIDSILNQRALKKLEFEIIVVDDNSTPPLNLRELGGWDFERAPIKLLRLAQNSGPAAARNAGILAASGELIAFLDSDDLWLPDKLSHQLPLLDEVTASKPDCLHAITCGFYYRSSFTERLHGRFPFPASDLTEFAGGCWFSPGSTLLLRKDCFSRVGLFDERLRALEDFEWFIRFGKLGGQLHAAPHLSVIVLRQPKSRTHEIIDNACAEIESKFAPDGAIPIGRGEWRLVRAYLCLERCVSNHYNGKPLVAFAYALASFTALPRTSARTQKYSTSSKQVTRQVRHAYDLMAQAALTRTDTYGKILVVVYSLSLGGTEKHLSLVLPALKRLGYSIKLYNISGIGDMQVRDKLAAETISLSASPSENLHARPRIVTLLRNVLGLIQAYLVEKPQIIHFFLPRAYMIGAPLAWILGRPKLVMSRRSLNNYQERHRLAAVFERCLHRVITVIVGNSQRVVDQLCNDERIPPAKLVLIYNGVAIDPFERPLDKKAKREQFGLGEEQLVLITVANLIGYKGYDDLIAAMASIKSELPQNWSLLIVGRDDGIGSRLKDKTRDFGISENVRFLGQRSDVAELMRIADIGLLCSHEEGFSNALLEMMAAGLPCIATNIGGNPEAVIDEVTGLLVPARDHGAIAHATLRLANDPDLRRQMGIAGCKRIRESFLLETCIGAYATLYHSLIQQQPSLRTANWGRIKRAISWKGTWQ